MILCIQNIDTLNICMKKFDDIKLSFDNLLLHKGFVSAQIVHARENQHVPGLSLKLPDTLHTLCGHIEH